MRSPSLVNTYGRWLIACAVTAALAASGCRPPGDESEGDATNAGVTGDGDPAVNGASEHEPNNDDAAAERVEVGSTLSGTLSEGDVDVFRLPAGEQAATVTIEGQGVTSVTVSSPRDGASYTAPPASGQVTVGPIPLETAAHITVRGSGSYTMNVAASPEPACGFAGESRDDTEPAATLTGLPAQTTGCLSSAADRDLFIVPAASFRDEPSFGIAISGVPGVSLSVRASDGERVLLADLTGGPGQDVLVPSIRAPQFGDVQLEIRSLSGANDRDAYRLELRRVPPLNGTVELEPNDTAVQATVVQVIDLINGYLHRHGDIDYYRLEVSEQRVIGLHAESPAGVDLQIFLDEGMLFGPATIDENEIGGTESICSVRVGPEEPFTFGIRARTQPQPALEPYLIHFDFFEGDDFEREPNNATTDLPTGDELLIPERQALGVWLSETQLSLSASGHLFPVGDVDMYALELFADSDAEATYTSVTVRLEPNGSNDYALELLDGDGGVLSRMNTGGRGETEMIGLDLPAGRYVARVTMVSGEECARPYRLVFEQTEMPEPMANGSVIILGNPEEGSGEPVPILRPSIPGDSPVRPTDSGRPERPQRPSRPEAPAPQLRPNSRTPVDPSTAPPAPEASEFWPGRERE